MAGGDETHRVVHSAVLHLGDSYGLVDDLSLHNVDSLGLHFVDGAGLNHIVRLNLGDLRWPSACDDQGFLTRH
jgi:hypothetical protein